MIGRNERDRKRVKRALDSALSVNVGASFFPFFLSNFYLKLLSLASAEFGVLFRVNSLPAHSEPSPSCWDRL